ncbi:hypothetical protein HYW76_04945 [Candidatus Pacearchaeota archaeon]|nr:hypothetical protein [Candidatus Pacearchaeota archaeon]
MKYTSSPEGDKKVEKDMREICSEINKKIKGVKTIILTGGFARGEGPVKIVGKKIYPYNDYDIQVISEEKISKEQVDKISDEISKKLGYRGIGTFYPFIKKEQSAKNNFYVDLKCDREEELKKLLPRIRTYELRNESLILEGEDLRKIIPDYKLKDIPLAECGKLLIDRMQMIRYYSTKGEHDEEFLTYITQQAYAAICTSLLMLNRKYEIGYRKAFEIFKKSYKKDCPELYDKIPNLDKKIEKFLKWKMDTRKIISWDAEEEFFIAKDNLLETGKYFFSKFLGRKIETTEELSKEMGSMKKEFYLPYLTEIVKQRIGITSRRWAQFLVPLVSLYLKYKYYKRLRLMGIKKIGVLFGKSPEFVIFGATPFMLDSISRKGVNLENLEKAKDIISEIYPSKGKNWEEVSIDYANAYIAFFLQKI